MKYELAPPKAGPMMEAVRAFGYDLPTALADLVDNSISASARNIWVKFIWAGGNSTITVIDDGIGMAEKELADAMRLANKSPLDSRREGDLGRFGLGLKTASFSQCRLLTVRSKRSGGPAAIRCWDIDFVVKKNDWCLLNEPPVGALQYLDPLEPLGSGTAVLWQQLDRLVAGANLEDRKAQDSFYAAADEVKLHLGMVFSDLMHGRNAVRIFINENPIESWDPFLAGNPAGQTLPQEQLAWRDAHITVSPYVLPHHSHLSAPEWNAAGGPRGWLSQQGFYVYRNRRLLVAGDWLGLGFVNEEHYKLARIRIDLDSKSDFDWDLDVKKSRAFPPVVLRDSLKKIARLTRSRASAVYRHRGTKLVGEPKGRVFLWIPKVRHGKKYYALNRNHPMVEAVIDNATDRASVLALLRLVEETLPVPMITFDAARNPQGHSLPFQHTATTQVQSVMRQVYRLLLESGRDPKEAKMVLLNMHPFEQFPELVETLDGNQVPEDDFDDGGIDASADAE